MSAIKDTKTFSINDILTWKDNYELELSPKYQRNKVWNLKAKSYLIDSIVRGYPIPQIFIRQNIDISTRKTYREVIDGQQRIRAIIEYLSDMFPIQKTHNNEYGNMKYSELPDEVKEDILNYNISFEIIKIKEDSKIYEMFARLNTNNVVLNKQELRNAQYWGDFKTFIYRKSAEYQYVFIDKEIFKDKELSRMADTSFMNSLVLNIMEGIITDSEKKFDTIYKKFDIEFNSDEIEEKLDKIFTIINKIFYDPLFKSKIFFRKTYFFTLFASINHQMYHSFDDDIPTNPLFNSENINNNIEILYQKLVLFENRFLEFQYDKGDYIDPTFANFEKYHRTRTTSKAERKERIKILCEYISE